MRLGLKLSLLLAGASAGPLVLATGVIVPVSREEVRRQLDGLYAQNASALAEGTDRALRDKLESLTLASSALRFASLDSASLEGALRLVYRQTKDVDVVALFDATGSALAPEAFLADPRGSGLPDHEAMGEAGLQAFAAQVPFSATLTAGRALGPVYVAPDAAGGAVPRLVMAVKVAGAGGAQWVLAAEVSLRSVNERFARHRIGATGHAFLVDGEGRLVAHPDAQLVASRADFGKHPLLTAGVAPRDLLGAMASVDLTGWRVVVTQSAKEALAPFERQQRAALWWAAFGLLAAFLLGFTSIRRVTFPVRRLREAAQAVAKGELDTQVMVRGRDELAELGEAFNQMTLGLRERERLKATFSRYVSGEIATRILSESSDLDVKGELVEATILFLDIRGFTNLSEQCSPREVVELLNAYFERVVSSVMRHEGVVNKFIGDAVMALFGAPRRVARSEEQAVRAALDIQEQVAQLSEERRRSGLRTAEFGAGVNTGPTIAGNLGSRERLEYTVIGDAVNLAQRLEGQAGPGEVLISATTLERLGKGFVVEPRGEVRIKGKQQPVRLFRVTGSPPPGPA